MNIKQILAAGVLAVSMPFAAGAAVVTGDFAEAPGVNDITGTGIVGSGDLSDLAPGGETVDFIFKATPKARAVGGVGTVRRSSTVEGLMISFDGSPVTESDDGVTLSFSFGPLDLGVDETVTLSFSWTAAASTDNIDFDIELAPVPVPAAGLMLLSVLGGGAFVARRKKKADA